MKNNRKYIAPSIVELHLNNSINVLTNLSIDGVFEDWIDGNDSSDGQIYDADSPY